MKLASVNQPQTETNGNFNKPVIEVSGLNLRYGEDQALKDIHLNIPESQVTANIRPSGRGKSTFIKTPNRMVEPIPNATVAGKIMYRGQNILEPRYRVEELRTKVGI